MHSHSLIFLTHRPDAVLPQPSRRRFRVNAAANSSSAAWRAKESSPVFPSFPSMAILSDVEESPSPPAQVRGAPARPSTASSTPNPLPPAGVSPADRGRSSPPAEEGPSRLSSSAPPPSSGGQEEPEHSLDELTTAELTAELERLRRLTSQLGSEKRGGWWARVGVSWPPASYLLAPWNGLGGRPHAASPSPPRSQSASAPEATRSRTSPP